MADWSEWIMTSANVVEYRIEKDGVVVGEHRQHALCHTKWHRLFKYTPFSEHTITPWGYDEEEAYCEGKTVTLQEFFDSKKNKFSVFSIQDMKRVVEFAEKQKELLEKWSEVSEGDDITELKKETRKLILHDRL